MILNRCLIPTVSETLAEEEKCGMCDVPPQRKNYLACVTNGFICFKAIEEKNNFKLLWSNVLAYKISVTCRPLNVTGDWLWRHLSVILGESAVLSKRTSV